MAGVDEVVENAIIITQTGDRDAAGTGETSRPNDADARARIMKLVENKRVPDSDSACKFSPF